jgi:hypothetical protein
MISYAMKIVSLRIRIQNNSLHIQLLLRVPRMLNYSLRTHKICRLGQRHNHQYITLACYFYKSIRLKLT